MFVSDVKLNGFRNYGEQKVKFLPSINLIVGKNGQGKTNLLESIYFASIGKSPKTSKETELINWSKQRASFCVNFEKKSGTKQIEVIFSRQSKKIVRVNSVNLLKIADLLGNLNVVFFSPDELKLVKDAPQDRRKFMDTDISQLNKNYFYNLTKYNKILDERNKLLKTAQTKEILEQTLPIWDTQLAETGSKIILERIKFLNKLKLLAKDAHEYLTNQKEDLRIEYAGVTGKDEDEIKQKLLKSLQNCREKDEKLGFTNIGPHRDDIKLVVNNIDIRSFGSQGQQRTVALSMKLAELEIFKEEIGEYPVLLLDDVLSELDQDRQQRLLNYCKKLQTIITATQYDPFMFQNANIIKINNGQVIK